MCDEIFGNPLSNLSFLNRRPYASVWETNRKIGLDSSLLLRRKTPQNFCRNPLIQYQKPMQTKLSLGQGALKKVLIFNAENLKALKLRWQLTMRGLCFGKTEVYRLWGVSYSKEGVFLIGTFKSAFLEECLPKFSGHGFDLA